MKTFKFKTSLKCNGCVQNIKPYLENKQEIVSWKVDLNHPDKILEVSAENISENDIIKQLTPSGYSFIPVMI